MVKRAWMAWAGIAVVLLAGCPEDDREQRTEALGPDDAGSQGGQQPPIVSSAGRSGGAAGWFGGAAIPQVSDRDDDGGVAQCEAPREVTRRASLDYCERCGAESASCCVVQGLCCREEWGELAPLEFDACESGAATCDLPASAFGPPDASYQSGAYVPAASTSLRSGLVMRGSVDASDRIRFGARLIRSDPKACPSCAELVGVGLSRQSVPDDASNLAPELSILVSSELSRLLLASGSTTLWSVAIDAEPHDVALERDPDGDARLSVDGLVQTVLKVPLPVGPLYPMVFGRSDPRIDRARSARVDSAFASSMRCERTAAWDERRAEKLPEGRDLPNGGRWRAPSLIALEGAGRWLAYESGGAITALNLEDPAQSLEFAGGVAAKLADPEWVVEGDRLALYYTAVGADGLRSLARARFGSMRPEEATEHSQLIAAGMAGSLELFGPSVAKGRDGELLLLATLVDLDGSQKLVLMSNLGDASEPRFELQTAQTVLVVERRAARQDYAALGSADLIYRRGQYQVYFAASSASRWAVSLLTSLDSQQWLSAGVVLEGVAGSSLDDSGVEDPETFVEGDTFNLYYTAHSAANPTTSELERWTLARASRAGRAICGGTECAEQADCALDGERLQCTPAR